MARLKTLPDGRHLVRWKTPDRKSPKKYFPAGRKPAAKRFNTSVEHSVLAGTHVDQGAALAAHVARYGLGVDGLLFTSTRGRPLSRRTFRHVWQRVAEPLGIDSGDGFHQLRHFYASTLIDAGESVKVVRDRLGHTTARQTLDTYAHLWPSSDDRTRAAVDAVLGQLGSSLGSGDAQVG